MAWHGILGKTIRIASKTTTDHDGAFRMIGLLSQNVVLPGKKET